LIGTVAGYPASQYANMAAGTVRLSCNKHLIDILIT